VIVLAGSQESAGSKKLCVVEMAAHCGNAVHWLHHAAQKSARTYSGAFGVFRRNAPGRLRWFCEPEQQFVAATSRTCAGELVGEHGSSSNLFGRSANDHRDRSPSGSRVGSYQRTVSCSGRGGLSLNPLFPLSTPDKRHVPKLESAAQTMGFGSLEERPDANLPLS
jgi:hypothetical protein